MCILKAEVWTQACTDLRQCQDRLPLTSAKGNQYCSLGIPFSKGNGKVPRQFPSPSIEGAWHAVLAVRVRDLAEAQLAYNGVTMECCPKVVTGAVASCAFDNIGVAIFCLLCFPQYVWQ